MRPLMMVLVVAAACSDEQVVVREVTALCGNGAVEVDEACDDGNTVNTDGCTSGCLVARCGDGVTRLDLLPNADGFEQCDDGNDNDNDACRSNCRSAVCGDGVVRADIPEGEPGFEACDDGNTDDLDGCTRGCNQGIDSDGDGHIDPADNCPQAPNADQADIDRDGAGDVCDPEPVRRNYKLQGRTGFSAAGSGHADDHTLRWLTGRGSTASGANQQFKLRGTVRVGADD